MCSIRVVSRLYNHDFLITQTTFALSLFLSNCSHFQNTKSSSCKYRSLPTISYLHSYTTLSISIQINTAAHNITVRLRTAFVRHSKIPAHSYNISLYLLLFQITVIKHS